MRRSVSLALKAFTLIEVVASLLLVGILLVGIMTAHRKLVNQARLAQDRIAAVEALDDLLSHAQASGIDPLVKLEGKVPGNNPFSWRTALREDFDAAALGGVIVKVELFNINKPTAIPLASVELLQPGAGELIPESR